MIKTIQYQKKAVEDMVRKVDISIDEGEKEYLFVSPTGSGKTIMVGTMFEEYIKKWDKEEVGIMWISPGKGDLAGQSKRSMEKFFNYFNSITLQDMINQGEIKGRDVVFVNWEAINKKDNVSIREVEKTNIYDALENSKLDKFLIVVDESHESRNSIKSNELLNDFNPDIVIDVTATPRKDRVYTRFNTTKVDINDVIAEEFIKNQIIINEGLDQLDLESVLKASIDKRNEIEVEYSKVEPDYLTPLILVQIENDKAVDTALGKTPKAIHIKNVLQSLGVEDDKIAIWVSDKKQNQNLDNLKTSDVQVLIFKSAVATGYDIPRAHILTKLRETGSEVFGIQVLGRVLRTVNKKFYGNKDVDSAFVFTEFTEYEYKLDLDEDLMDRVREGKTQSFIKKEYKPNLKFELPMRKKQKRLEHTINSSKLKERVDRELTSQFVNTLILDESKLNERMYTGSLESGRLLEEDYFSGLEEGNVKMTDKAIKKEYIKRTKKINSQLKMTAYILNALKQHRDYKFPIDAMKIYLSNEVSINEKVSKAIEDYYELNMDRSIEEKTYKLPEEVYYLGVLDKVSENYVYDNQPNLSVEYTKSSSEEMFSEYLSNNENVLYWWKNNVGGENFSEVYQSSDFSNKEYYPDFIYIDKNNKLNIFDVKAPIKNNTTNDFKDIEAKYISGKDYESRNRVNIQSQGFSDIEFSMVKYKEDKPYICKTSRYNEDFDDKDKWEELNI